MKEKIVQEICSYVSLIKEYPVEVSRETDLRNDLGLDSIDATDLASYLERQYNVEIDNTELPIFHRKVEDIAEFICSKLENGSKVTS